MPTITIKESTLDITVYDFNPYNAFIKIFIANEDSRGTFFIKKDGFITVDWVGNGCYKCYSSWDDLFSMVSEEAKILIRELRAYLLGTYPQFLELL